MRYVASGRTSTNPLQDTFFWKDSPDLCGNWSSALYPIAPENCGWRLAHDSESHITSRDTGAGSTAQALGVRNVLPTPIQGQASL